MLLFVYPPTSEAAHPPLGLASLAGALRAAGERVRVLDLNLHSYEQLLRRDYLLICGKRLGRRLAQLEEAENQTAGHAAEYARIALALLKEPYLLANTEAAIRDLRAPRTYESRAAYSTATKTLTWAMEFVAAAHHPATWSPRGFDLSYSSQNSSQVLQAIDDRRENFFLPFLEKQMSAMVETAPDAIGISINYFCQLIPGLTLAALVKKHLGSVPVIIGGSLTAMYEGRWDTLLPFSHLFDVLVPFDGEEPIVEIMRAIRRGDHPGTVPGAVRFDGGVTFETPRAPGAAPTETPLPSFEGFPLDSYLSPRRILPYATTTGCYWRGCAFCAQGLLYRRRFFKKDASRVLRDLESLSIEYGATEFYFIDEAVPPATAKKLCAAIREGNLPYQWIGEFRFEKTLMPGFFRDLGNGGCRMLMFGFESAVPRVLERMKKGTSPEKTVEILRACAENDIRTFLMFFFGFPGETREEAEATATFIEDHQSNISHIGFSSFMLFRRTPIHETAEEYGLTCVKDDPEMDLALVSNYETSSGMSDVEARLMVKRIKQRPRIGEILELPIMARAHLAFLPQRRERDEDARDRAGKRTPCPVDRHLAAKETLTNLSLKFNLDDIARTLENKSDIHSVGEIEPNETSYVYDPISDTLTEVDENALILIGFCDGSRTLGDILSLTGSHNHSAVEDFFGQLVSNGFVELGNAGLNRPQ